MNYRVKVNYLKELSKTYPLEKIKTDQEVQTALDELPTLIELPLPEGDRVVEEAGTREVDGATFSIETSLGKEALVPILENALRAEYFVGEFLDDR